MEPWGQNYPGPGALVQTGMHASRMQCSMEDPEQTSRAPPGPCGMKHILETELVIQDVSPSFESDAVIGQEPNSPWRTKA